MKRYAITVAENVRRYTTHYVDLDDASADLLLSREQQEVDGDADVMDLLEDMGGMVISEEIDACDEPETVIINVEEN